MDKLLEISNLQKLYSHPSGKIEILKGVDLNLYEGEIIAICGPSGSGKTTLLHIIGLLDSFDNGRIVFNGYDYANLLEKQKTQIRKSQIGFIFQFFNLIEEISVKENILLPLRFFNNFDMLRYNNFFEKLINSLKIDKRLNFFPADLSGGEQQRVALARAIIKKPKLLLADEPTGNLDKENANEVWNLMLELVKENNSSLIIATHNEELAKRCNKVLLLKDGRII